MGDTPNRDLVEQRGWHALPPGEVTSALATDPERGLEEQVVERRRAVFGPNSLPERARARVWQVFLRQFKDPLIYILLIAGAVSLTLGNHEDAAFIFAVLLFNAILGTYQEWKAENAAQALQQVMQISAAVIRGGKRRQIDSDALVPGDLVLLESGAAVPADIRLLQSRDLRADESLLTGESTPVDKQATAELAEDAALGDRVTLLHAGSNVTSGRALGVVVRTGQLTEVGRIAESLSEEAQVPPLVIRLRRFTRIIALGVIGIIVILGGAQLLRGEDLTQIFFLAVALAVSAIPAGLPVAITVALSIGSSRMAQRNVIVRLLPAVEGLGACTLVASDKTGTLTANKLTVKRIRSLDAEEAEVEGEGYATRGAIKRGDEEIDLDREPWLRELAESAVLCNGAEFETNGETRAEGDTVDVAFLVLGRKLGLTRDELLERHEEIGGIPFESERRFAATFNRHGDRIIAHVKGAASTLIEMCDVDADEVQQQEQALANDGYRVLAVARGEVDERAGRDGDVSALRGLTWLGLVGQIDPIRSEVPDAIAKSRAAGVDVRMITGDHPATALAIARSLELADQSEQVVAGKELGQDEQGASRRVREAQVYARVEPRQKTTIVTRLQDAGHFVAVTGDGVNDAPALRAAHIGVSMGQSGTDVARNASDLILTDDNFASIVNGIEQGRIAYDNVRKVVWLLISTGVAELLLFTLSVAFNTPLPLNPVQLLWLNLVTNGIQDVALAFESGEPDVLGRKPRSPGERIFNRLMIEQVAMAGVHIGLVGFGAFYLLVEVWNVDPAQARNLLLLLMVLFENVHAFNCRSETRSVFRVPLGANKLLVSAVLAAQGVHIASMFIPGWRDILGIEPVSLTTWLYLLGLALTLLASAEAYKHLRGRALAERGYQRPPNLMARAAARH